LELEASQQATKSATPILSLEGALVIFLAMVFCVCGSYPAYGFPIHPIIVGVISWLTPIAIEKHNEAAERLGYAPLLPPPPFGGPQSEWHKQETKRVTEDRLYREQKEKFYKEQEKVREIEKAEEKSRTA
jgi:hypothetical protein